MKRRPLVITFLGIAGGILTASFFRITELPAALLAIVLILSLLFTLLEFTNTLPRFSAVLIILLLIAFGMYLYSSQYFHPDQLYPKLLEMNSVKGQIVNFPTKSKNGNEFIIKTDHYPGRIKVYLKSNPTNVSKPTSKGYNVNYGDKLRLSGDFAIPSNFENFKYRENLRKKRIWGVVYNGVIQEKTKDEGNFLLHLGWLTRKAIFSRLDKLFQNRSGFLKGVLFGTRDALDQQTTQLFERTGLAHLLAASGLHLGIIIGGSWWIFSKLGFTSKSLYIISLPILLVYLMIVGFKLPLSRASLIYLFAGAHFYFRDRSHILSSWYDSYQALAGAALIIILINPNSLTDVGFQLSFGATFALALFFNPIKERINRIRPEYVRDILAASLAAHLGVLPIIAISFHTIHMWGVLVNLIAIPAITIILYLGILSLLWGKLLFIGYITTYLTSRFIDSFNTLLEAVSHLPLVQIAIQMVSPTALAAYVILLFWFKLQLSKQQVGYHRVGW